MAIGSWSAISRTSLDIGGIGCDLTNHRLGVATDTGYNADFTLGMYSVNNAGARTSLGTQTYTLGYGSYVWSDTPQLFHIRGDVWAVQGSMQVGASYLLMICTVEADSSGFKPGILDSLVITTDRPYTVTKRYAQVVEGIYAFPYVIGLYETKMTTLQIEADGSITHLDTESISSLYTSVATCCRVYGNVFLMGSGQPRVDTISIDESTGVITKLANSTNAATYYYCADLFAAGLNAAGDAMVMGSLSSSGSAARLQTFEVSLDGLTIGNQIASESLGNGSNRGNCGVINVGVGGSSYYFFWGAQDTGDWDADIGIGYLSQAGGITWGFTVDGQWAWSSGGGPNLVSMQRIWSNPNGDNNDIYVLSHPRGFGTLWAETYLPPEINSITPASGSQGETLTVTIAGQYLTGATDVDLGSDITVNSYTVDSDTQITASISIAAGITAGTTDVEVTTGGGTATLADGFTILSTEIRQVMMIQDLCIPYVDLDDTKELHVVLENLSPTSKRAGDQGMVIIDVSYDVSC